MGVQGTPGPGPGTQKGPWKTVFGMVFLEKMMDTWTFKSRNVSQKNWFVEKKTY